MTPTPLPSVEACWELMLAQAAQLESIRLPLDAALGRILRDDARAGADSPPFDAAAMDGYAAYAADGAGRLRVVGTSQAGAGFAGSVQRGECVRIFTGAPVPAGLDRVVKQEDAIRDGEFVRVPAVAGPTHVRRRGENRRHGEVLVRAGTRLGPTELAALASAGLDQPEVTRAPRCVHLVTGNELVAPGETPANAQIRDSNSTLVGALLRRHGAELVGQARAPDDLTAAQSILAGLPAHDVLLISGGASVGDLDLARPLLAMLNYTVHFQQINLRPGKPLVFASRGARLAFALPGNPVSHWVVFHLFVAPLLTFLETGVAPTYARLVGRLTPDHWLPPPDTRQTFWPCRAVPVDARFELTSLTLASSGDSSGLVGANALLPLPLVCRDPDNPRVVEFIPCP